MNQVSGFGGSQGFVPQNENNYDEPSALTGNRSFTDFAAAAKIRQDQVFKDRRIIKSLPGDKQS